MSCLRIRLFGAVQISHDGCVPQERPIRAVQALLAYLVLNRTKIHAREVLAALFWGEHTEARARSCLSTALWRLRQVLEPDGIARGTYLRTLRSGEIGFNSASNHWVDVAAFEDGLKDMLRTNPQRQQSMDWTGAENAVAHYTGDLLEGFYDDWALRERERLRLGYLSALGRLLQHYSESGAVDLGLDCAWRILELDPLREEVHREVMRLHLRTGHRALAWQQYERCRELLARELEAEPMEETRQLYLEITGESDRVVIAQTSLPSQPGLLSPLRAAAMRLDAAREELGRAIRMAEDEQDGSAR